MRHTREVVDASPDLIFSVDRDRRLSYSNRAFAALVGKTPRLILGLRIPELGLPPRTAKVLESGVRSVLESAAPGSLEITLPHGDGLRYHAHLLPGRADGGGDTAVIGVLRDVTDLLRDRARELAETNRQLAAAKEEMEFFSRAVIHDVGNQVVALGMLAHRLQRLHEAGRFGDEATAIDQVRRQALRIEESMRDLGKLLRAGKIELSPTTCDLSALARTIAEGFPRREDGVGAVWVIPAGIEAHGDPRLLRILLENLLGNAWKFSRGAARPRIEFGRTRDGTYFVRDNGRGFDSAAAQKLFAPFRRGHDDDNIEGTGMGLAIVERIVARHGGSVWGESAPGGGACFSFTLPGASHPPRSSSGD